MKRSRTEDAGAIFLSALSLPSLAIDHQGRIARLNEAAARMLGVPAGAGIGRPLEEVVRAEPRLVASEVVQSVQKSGSWNAECMLRVSSGRPVRGMIVAGSLKREGLDHQVLIVLCCEGGDRESGGRSFERSERQFRYCLQSVGEGVVLFDPLLVILFANSVAGEILGASPESLAGRNLGEFLDAQERHHVQEQTERQRRGETSTFEARITRADGETRWIRMTASPRTNENGEYLETLGVFQDVTERKGAEEELALERSLLSALMENIPVYIYFKDTESRFIRNSRAHAAAFGLRDCAEAIGKTDWDFFSREHAQKAYEDEQRIVRTGQPILNVEEKETWPNRPDTWVLTTKMPLRDQEGRIVGTFGISRDITERKRHELEIARLNRLYREMSMTNQLIVRETNRQRLLEGACRIAVEEGGLRMAWIGFVEAETRRLVPVAWSGEENGYLSLLDVRLDDVSLGRTPEGTAARENRHVLHADIASDPLMAPSREAALQRGYRSSASFPLSAKGKVVGVFSLYAGEPDFFTADQLSLMDELSRDISYALDNLDREDERMRAEAALEETLAKQNELQKQLAHVQKMEAVGRLAGGIAHDFNNVLTAIIGYGAFLEMKLPQDGPMRHGVAQIMSAAKRAAQLTQGLLAFSRKQIVDPRAIDINETIRQVEPLLARLTGEDIELRAQTAPEALVVMADSGQIEQVLMNLTTNSRDAMPDGGRITITTLPASLDSTFIQAHGYGKTGRYALICFEDTGTGIGEETQKKIFEPFFTTKEIGKGTGLGLSIVYGIVKEHGGYITVYSEPGQGTAFRIYLPLTPAAAEGVSAEQEFTPAGGSETVLLVEDDPIVRGLTAAILAQGGYRVIEAHDGQDALQKFRDNQEAIRLLLTDLIMPKKGGVALVGEIQQAHPAVRALFTSGYTANVIYQKGLLEKGQDFIAKPYLPRELLRRVREVLDR